MAQRTVRTLASLAARTTSGTSAELAEAEVCRAGWSNAVLVLECTAAAAAYADTCNVYVQSSHDGLPWHDVASFEQLHGNEGVRTYLKRLSSGLPTPADQARAVSGELLAGVVLPWLVPGALRVRWVMAGSAPAFTFAVTAILER